MKGLTHFSSGVCLASFFAPAVAMAAMPKSGCPDAASSLILALGGLYGIMPDTFDFKFGRFFVKEDVTLEFDPADPDPQDMARQIGEALDLAAETGKYMQIQYNPMRLGASLWRQYVIKYDGDKHEVIVVINEVVTTSQVPFPDTAPAPEKRVGIYRLKKAKFLAGGKPSTVDILSGPMMGYAPTEIDGQKYIGIEFLPWHRTWSHSYMLGIALGALAGLFAWLMQLDHWWLYGLVSILGYAIHITEDLTGHMGGSLLWPFKGKRYDGFCWFKASDPRANFSVDYACFVITLFNLDRYSMVPSVIGMPWYQYFFLFLVIPLAVYFGVYGYCIVEEDTKKDAGKRAEGALARFTAARNDEAEMEEESMIG